MISFEMEDMPIGQNITNDEFSAVHEIVSQDWDQDYRVFDAVLGWEGRTLLVERVGEDERLANAVFKLGVDGDWQQVWERTDAVQG